MARNRKARGVIVAGAAPNVRSMSGTRDLVTGGELFIYGEITPYASDDWGGVSAVDVIDSLARLPAGSEVVVRINSPGGVVTEGIAIYNALRADKRRVIIQVDAMAASIASIIMCAGDEIVLAETASVMIHDPWSFAAGGSGDLRAMADEIDRLKGIILDIYEKRSGLGRDEISALMSSETYMSAADAIERGFADRIIPDLKVAACAPLDREKLARLLFVSEPAPGGGNVKPNGEAAPSANIEESEMNVAKPNAAGAPGVAPQSPAPTPAAPAAPVAPAPVVAAVPNADEIRAAERQRSADIMAAVLAARLPMALAQEIIASDATVDQARARVIDALAAAQTPDAGPDIRPDVRVTRDARETMRVGMTEALVARLTGAREVQDVARPFMDASLVDMAAESSGYRGRLSNAARREDAIRNAFHTTSDFPIILENAVNRTLAARYAAAQPTYRRIATQRVYTDFRDHISVRAGDFPQLQPVNETGEIKSGTFSESKEKTAVKAYGVRVNFSRQLLVNDSLGAIAQILNSRGDAVARFEEETFYAMMLSASGAGPTLLETTRAVFNTTDKTLAASGGVINVANLGAGRAAMRKKKTMDGMLINVSPSILLVGPDKETEAQTVVAPIQAAQQSNVNPFSGSLQIIVCGQISGNAWHLFVDPSVVANFEWGLLEGYSAPRMRMDEPFGVQGVSYSLEHDFGCGAINFRGGWRNPGD